MRIIEAIRGPIWPSLSWEDQLNIYLYRVLYVITDSDVLKKNYV